MVFANSRITVKEVAEDLDISIGSCYSIVFNDLSMRRETAKFVPKLLNFDQKQHRMNIANEMLDSVRDDPNLIQKVITGDETWVYGYDVETKAQSSQWKLPHPFSSIAGALCIMSSCHKLYAICASADCCQKCPDLWKNKNWLLHDDNASAHTSLLVRDFLAKNNTLMMPQPSQIWSPRLFLVPETEEAHERSTLRYDWRDEDDFEGAEQDK